MIGLRAPSSRVAATVLREVFGRVQAPFACRLWDGTEVRVGSGEPPFTAVFKSPESFSRLIRHPTPGDFAEAYVSSAIDIEGDLSAAMTVADVVEELRLSLWQRLRILGSLVMG